MTRLNEQTLEDALRAIRGYQSDTGVAIKMTPTKLLVQPIFYNRFYLLLNSWIVKRKAYLKRRKRK